MTSFRCGWLVLSLSLVIGPLLVGCDERRTVPERGYDTWEVYGGGADGIRYSTLTQIDKTNVFGLEVAWTYETGDSFEGSEMQCNPIIVDRVLYATTPKLRVIALDAASGELLWSFDPHEGREVRGKQRNRGVTYWGDGKEGRIFVTADHHLMALDARRGELIPSFGRGGRVDLREGLGRDPKLQSVSVTTPGTIAGDLLVLGSRVGEALPASPGHVRAYDVRTGALAWSFRTIPQPGEFGAETWPADAWTYTGGANSWAGAVYDATRNAVYVPTGSAAFDFYGANRHGDNLFANCLLCLDATTGERRWHFQFVKHDVWDRDLPAPPCLVSLERDGEVIEAVAQITKSGHVFVFDRDDGTPLFPIEYREVPPSDAPGEKLAKTQPLPLSPPPFARQRFTESIATRRTPEAHRTVVERLATLRSGDQYTPPSREGTVIFPGFDGGAEWGGAAFDPETGVLYVNSNEMAWVLRLVERESFGTMTSEQLYRSHCAACHREDMKGTPPEFPGVLDLGAKYTIEQVASLTKNGVGRMSAFSFLSDLECQAIAEYLVEGTSKTVKVTTPALPIHQRFRIDGYNKFLDPDGYPAVEPPWGTLSAIDLDDGTLRWQIPLGEFPQLAAEGEPDTGTENYGGPLVTASGLLFIGATNHDQKFRAFDKVTGEELWEHELPASGNATPSTYQIDGRQYVVIAAGGGKSGAPSGGTYVAFALPR